MQNGSKYGEGQTQDEKQAVTLGWLMGIDPRKTHSF